MTPPTVHIHAPAPNSIRVYAIWKGGRKWKPLPNRPRSIASAKRTAALALADLHYIRGVRVVLSYEWYDPHVAFEALRVSR